MLGVFADVGYPKGMTWNDVVSCPWLLTSDDGRCRIEVGISRLVLSNFIDFVL